MAGSQLPRPRQLGLPASQGSQIGMGLDFWYSQILFEGLHRFEKVLNQIWVQSFYIYNIFKIFRSDIDLG